jgi:hypothetical protein
VCICFNCMQLEKFMWHSSVDVGYVTVCSAERTKEFSGVAWPDMDGRGCYKLVSELQFSTLSLDGPNKLS